MANIVCFGEVLWDMFPTHKKIGGAPLNVALRLHSFKNKVTIISSVGADENGVEILNHIKKEGLESSTIQINSGFKTSEVLVRLNAKGSASYSIEFPCAWDFITINKTILNTVKKADAFIFGSLVARNKESYGTLLDLLEVASYKIFDVNLRPPHYNFQVLESLMQKADFIKCNDEELFEICNTLQFNSSDVKENIQFISEKTNTNTICVTLGENGAVLFNNKTFYISKGYAVRVEDTVGAGDSFLATLIHHLLKKESPKKAIDFACAVGAIVASREGANPKIQPKEINSMILG